MEKEKPYKTSIFIFRRDFRLVDNNGLNAASRESETVVPIFHFNPLQILPEKNEYFNHGTVQVMCECLDDLDGALRALGSRLIYFFGDLEESWKDIVDQVKPEAMFVNEDYSPFSIERDKCLKKLCEERGIKFHSLHDYMLNEKTEVVQANGQFYTQYTPFYMKASKKKVPRPDKYEPKNFISGDIEFKNEFKGNIHDFYTPVPELEIHGGRKRGLEAMDNLKNFKEYSKMRIYPSVGTTKISPHAKYGTLSIREIYWTIADKFGKSHELMRQLFWRDFYYNITYHHPDTVFDAFIPQFKGITWPFQEIWFEAWRNGMTGFPFIDAGMRHLKATKYFTNIMRMVVANFLVKILLIDWRKGQLHLGQQMLDYDLSQNNGGWQWAAATGSVGQPFDVIFNPWIQGKQYDADCKYIKQWIPELKDVPNEHIHNWYKHYEEHPDVNYPKPIVNYEERKQQVIDWYQHYYGGASKKVINIDIDSAVMTETMFEDEEIVEGDLEDFI